MTSTPPPEPVAPEPVAWIDPADLGVTLPTDGWCVVHESRCDPGSDHNASIPLYTTPPSAERASEREAPEIRRNDDGTLDEVCGTGTFHLEQMDTNHWWLGVQQGTTFVHVYLRAKGKITEHAELDARAAVRAPAAVEPLRLLAEKWQKHAAWVEGGQASEFGEGQISAFKAASSQLLAALAPPPPAVEPGEKR